MSAIRRQARGRGELEAAVLEALQQSTSAMTASQLRQVLGDGLAYTTVLTILVRLHDKGVLARERCGRAHAYWPVRDDAGLAARRMHRVLEEEPDRDAVLARFVGDLSDTDEQVLRRLLEH